MTGSSDFLEYLVPAYIIVFIIIYFVRHKKESAQITEALNQQAIKRNGTVTQSFLTYPRLTFSHGDAAVTVSATPGGKNRPPYTHLAADLNLSMEFKIRIYKELRLFGIGRVFGQDVKVNNPAFDDAFIIKGSDETTVHHFLTSAIQAKLLDLRDLNLNLEITHKKLKFSFPKLLKEQHEYDILIGTGTMMIDRLKELG